MVKGEVGRKAKVGIRIREDRIEGRKEGKVMKDSKHEQNGRKGEEIGKEQHMRIRVKRTEGRRGRKIEKDRKHGENGGKRRKRKERRRSRRKRR